jgi:hypothetical protein
MREALVIERRDDDLQRLLVTLARFFDRHAAFQWYPSVTASEAELVAAVDQHVELRDLRGEHRRVVIGQHVQQRAEFDVARALRGLGEERERVRRGAEFRKEKMFDDRVGRIAEPVGIHHLLKRLGVNLLLRFAGPGLKLGINGELHDGGPSPRKPPILSRGAATLSKQSASLQAVGGLLGEDNFPTAC